MILCFIKDNRKVSIIQLLYEKYTFSNSFIFNKHNFNLYSFQGRLFIKKILDEISNYLLYKS